MPAEEEQTAVTVSETMPDTDSIIKEPTNDGETKKLTTATPVSLTTPLAGPVEKISQTTENEATDEEEKKNKEDEKESENEEVVNKENLQENNTNVNKENTTDVVKTKADADIQTDGIVLRKRRTPEKNEGKDEDVSPPKKAK